MIDQPKSPKTELSGSRKREYMNWAGVFVDPEFESDACESLPRWRQYELRSLKKCRHGERQPTEADLRRIYHRSQNISIEVPLFVQFSIGDSVPLHLLEKMKKNRLQSIANPDQLDPYLSTDELKSQLCDDLLNLKERAPTDGFYAYLWRIARYKCGIDKAIPITVFIDLDDSLLDLTGKEFNRRELIVYLDSKVSAFLELLDEPRHASEAWWKLLKGS